MLWGCGVNEWMKERKDEKWREIPQNHTKVPV